MIATIRHIHIPAPIHCHAIGSIEARCFSLSIGKTRYSRTCQRRHRTTRSDLPDSVIATIRHIHIPTPINSQARRKIKARLCSLPIGKSGDSRTCQRRYSTTGTDLPDSIVVCISHIHIPAPFHCNTIRIHETGFYSDPITICDKPSQRCDIYHGWSRCHF